MVQPVHEEIPVRKIQIQSRFLERKVLADIYLPAGFESLHAVLLINDGQDLAKMPFAADWAAWLNDRRIAPVACVGIHAGPDRRREYGTAASPDYLGRGNKAPGYTRFILEELRPFLLSQWPQMERAEWAIAGFSLGGLSALDIGWHHPVSFRTIGVFSGSLWWRSRDTADPAYRDEQHRLMHAAIRSGEYHPGQRFFFECGTEDETEDRNKNGIIDSIDDTKDLIGELEKLGQTDICYHEISGGKHDVMTWAAAMPVFFRWAWGIAGAGDTAAENKSAAYKK